MTSKTILRRAVLKAGCAGALAASYVFAPAVLRGQPRATVAEDMARWIVALRYEQLPANVVAAAKRVLFDTLGCALGGVSAAPVLMAEQVVALQGGNPQATAIGLGRKVSCDQAAFLNGMALRYLDYNDYAALGRPHHPSINVAPALAVAEMQRLSGKDLLLGIATGYEVQVRLRDAIGARGRDGWDGTSITAQYSAAAAAGKLLGLDAAKLANALAIAGSNANTLAEVRRGAELTPAKGSAEPIAARNGTFAALLARAGLSYPLTIIEGEGGYAKMVAGPLNEDILRWRTGDFEILKSSIKLWPSVGTAQAPIAAASEIYRQKPASEIAAITIALSDFAYGQQQAMPKEINTREHADHSVRYLVARTLLDGNVTMDDFTESRFRDPRALALIGKMVLRSEPALPDNALGANIEARLASGQVLKANVPIPPGDMRNPADAAKLATKFLALSEKVLGPERAQRAISIIRSVETMTDLAALVTAVAVQKPR
jgi:2-methylcitrate dehydratase